MNWVEIITLRSKGNLQESIIKELLKSVAGGGENNGLLEIKIYRNVWIDTDMSVHLHWKSIPAELRGSAMGLRLVHILKEFGLVNHSAWVEERKQS
jgi:hypothetical protein